MRKEAFLKKGLPALFCVVALLLEILPFISIGIFGVLLRSVAVVGCLLAVCAGRLNARVIAISCALIVVGVPIFATIMIIANELIETKLKAKGEPHAVEDYYPAYSLVNPREEHVSIWTHMFAPIIKIFSKKQKAVSKQNSTEKEPQDTSDEALEKINQSNEQEEKENNGTANE